MFRDKTDALTREMKKLKKSAVEARKENQFLTAANEAKTESIKDLTTELETVKEDKAQLQRELNTKKRRIEEVEALATKKARTLDELKRKLRVLGNIDSAFGTESESESHHSRERRTSSRDSRSRSRSPPRSIDPS